LKIDFTSLNAFHNEEDILLIYNIIRFFIESSNRASLSFDLALNEINDLGSPEVLERVHEIVKDAQHTRVLLRGNERHNPDKKYFHSPSIDLLPKLGGNRK